MADKGELWDQITACHGLRPISCADVAAWPFAVYVFGCHWDVMSHTLKIRQAGCHDCVDVHHVVPTVSRAAGDSVTERAPPALPDLLSP